MATCIHKGFMAFSRGSLQRLSDNFSSVWPDWVSFHDSSDAIKYIAETTHTNYRYPAGGAQIAGTANVRSVFNYTVSSGSKAAGTATVALIPH